MPYGTGDERLERLANAAIGAAMAVHTALGPGLREDVYQRAMCEELDARGIPFEANKYFEIHYRGKLVGWGWIDILVDGILILELKAVTALGEAHRGQAIHYLRACKLKLALLMNFHEASMKSGVKRVVN